MKKPEEWGKEMKKGEMNIKKARGKETMKGRRKVRK